MNYQSALHIKTKVSRSGRIEVQLPSGLEGQEVNIFVLPSTDSSNSRTQYSDLAEMASDPDIQREIAAIKANF